MLFHGTTHYFRKFNNKHGRGICHVGKGVYLTNKKEDALHNYASEKGPDIRQKYYAEEYDSEKYLGNKKYLLECAIRENLNFAILGKKWYDIYTYNEETEDFEYTQLGVAITNCGYDISLESEMTLEDIRKQIWNDNSTWEDGNNPGSIFRDILIEAGFDGVIYEDAHDYFPGMVNKGTVHYVVYDARNVMIRKRKNLGLFLREKVV